MAGNGGSRLGRGCRRALCLGVGLLGVFAAGASSAWASCANQVYDEALPVSSSSPPNAAAYAPTSNRVGWEVVTQHGLSSLYVRVATQETLGNDGTLSTLNAVDDFGLFESNTYGYYTGASNGGSNWWPNRPGQYYWQAFGIGESVDPSTGILTCHLYAGPVYTITIVAPQPAQPQGPAPITNQEIAQYAHVMIFRHTGRRPFIRGTCNSVPATATSDWCKIHWNAAGSSYSGSGTFWNYLGSDGKTYGGWNFSGTRTWRVCGGGGLALQALSGVGCSVRHRRFHWQS